jgi:hypothetical protein
MHNIAINEEYTTNNDSEKLPDNTTKEDSFKLLINATKVQMVR